jgi:hypothetical protein
MPDPLGLQHRQARERCAEASERRQGSAAIGSERKDRRRPVAGELFRAGPYRSDPLCSLN